MQPVLPPATVRVPAVDLSQTPQSARIVYQRLMLARESLDRRSDAGHGKPRLAYISPLPPEHTGIADYSAEVIPELANHYSVDVIVAQAEVSDPWIREHCVIRDVEWFERHAHSYDRIVYHLGNSRFHLHMFPLLEKYPGVVVLHDFYLSNVLSHRAAHGDDHGILRQALYHSHGYGPSRDSFDPKKFKTTVFAYPANLAFLQNAQGVIVHSNHAVQMAKTFYGKEFVDNWVAVPFPRRLPESLNRKAAREQLGIAEHDILVCCFGMLGETKMNQRLLQAWLETPLASDSRCHLVFVGFDDPNDHYCMQFHKAVQTLKTADGASAADRIRVTGFVPEEIYKTYLQAADIAVQLRTLSRGETSAAVVDCMSHGLPTIVNANGSLVELPQGGVCLLPDDFSTAKLADAITQLWQAPERRLSLGRNARALAMERNSPHRVVDRYREAIDAFSEQAPPTLDLRALGQHVAALEPASPESPAWLELAQKLALEHPPKMAARQLFVDVSILARADNKTGIERVARSQLLGLLNNPPPGFRVEPVRLNETPHWHYRYARRYTAKVLNLPEDILDDDPIETTGRDIFYMPDFFPNGVWQAANAGVYTDLRARGVETSFLIYDILPLLRPDCFPEDSEKEHARWLVCLPDIADRLICISGAVVDDTRQWLKAHRPDAAGRIEITALHLGADIDASAPSKGLPANAAPVLEALSSRPSFLMVGTIEPRKGYLQTLAAFERLWQAGVDVNLVIVGAEGWKQVPTAQRRTIPQTVKKLRDHPERDKRLFWLEGISDEYLETVYARCVCLIAASEGEGFGLPLIEAARHKIPILARDIQSFREVAGAHASYFAGLEAEDLTKAIKDWLASYSGARHSKSDDLPWLTWAENVERLKAILVR